MLTHAGTVNVELLGGEVGLVEEESTVLDVESGRLLLGASAAGVLRLQAGEEAALGGVPGGVLDGITGVDGEDVEGLLAEGSSRGRGGGSSGGDGGGGNGRAAGGRGESSSSGSGRGGEDEVLELHDGRVGKR